MLYVSAVAITDDTSGSIPGACGAAAADLREHTSDVLGDLAWLLGVADAGEYLKTTRLTAAQREVLTAKYGSAPESPSSAESWLTATVFEDFRKSAGVGGGAGTAAPYSGGAFSLFKKKPAAPAASAATPAAAAAPAATPAATPAAAAAPAATPAVAATPAAGPPETPARVPQVFGPVHAESASYPPAAPYSAFGPVHAEPAVAPAAFAAEPAVAPAVAAESAAESAAPAAESAAASAAPAAPAEPAAPATSLSRTECQELADSLKIIERDIDALNENIDTAAPVAQFGGAGAMQERVSAMAAKMRRITDQIPKISDPVKRNEAKLAAAEIGRKIAVARRKISSGAADSTATAEVAEAAEDSKAPVKDAAPAPAADAAPEPAAGQPPNPEAAKNVFRAVAEVLAAAFAAFKASPIQPLIAAVLSLLLVISLCVLSIVYVVRIALDYSNSVSMKNPVNSESMDYNVSRSGDTVFTLQLENVGSDVPALQRIKNFSLSILKLITSAFGSDTKYKYQLFIIVPWLIIALSAIGLFFVVQMRIGKNPRETPGFITGILAGCFLHGVTIFFLNNVIYLYGNKPLRLVSMRIRSYNTYIYNRMYKNGDFLKSLTEINSNTFESIETVKNILRQVPKSIGTLDLAKVMFSLNMYLHAHKLGLRNPNIVDALGTFSPMYMLNASRYSPSDYLFRHATFVDDYSQVMVSAMRSLQEENWVSPPAKTVYEAAMLVNEWASGASNKANSLYVEDSVSPFIKMALAIAVVQWLPVIVLVLVLRKKEARDGFMSVIVEYAARRRAAA